MNFFTKTAATIIAAAAILGAGAGVASAATAPATPAAHVAVQSGKPMIERRVTFVNNTTHSIYISDVQAETEGDNQGCHWSTGLPALWTVITPGEGFQAAVLFETFEDTQCYFQVNKIDSDGAQDSMFDAGIDIDVNAIDQITPTFYEGGINMVPTYDGTGDLTSVSYVDPS